jgi:XTP/dITP diphosphohydrolase
MDTMRLVFASNNGHKLAEVRKILSGIEVVSLHDIGFEQEIEETGLTLEENSAIKAETVWEWLSLRGCEEDIDGVFADDTGLEIDALDGEPGVYTARWAERETGVHLGEMETYAANREKALRELAGKANRGCQFRTVVTLIRAGKSIQVEGVVRGKMTKQEYGEGGFGYDPIFIPDGYDKTFGELPAEIKNNISHRARALEALVRILHE